jgi:hypothetical protein
MSRQIFALILAASALAFAITAAGGVRLDYVYYLEQWDLVLAGADPWSTNNAYGPLHNAFAWLVPVHELLPKFVTAGALLFANAALVWRLLRTAQLPDWLPTYLLAFGANALVWVSAFWLGLNDGFVTGLLIFAVLARFERRMLLTGFLIGLATLDKYYPALLLPFLALDEQRRFSARLVLTGLLTIAAGIGAAVLLWGNAYAEALRFGIGRDATILSILQPVALIGRAHGLGDLVDVIIRMNGPMVLIVAVASFALALWRREHWLVAATWSFFALLLTYKVGNQQFWVSWLALVACLPLSATAEGNRLARLSVPFAIFLSLFELGYVFLTPNYYQGQWHWVVEWIGIPAFALGALQLWLFLRPASRPRA